MIKPKVLGFWFWAILLCLTGCQPALPAPVAVSEPEHFAKILYPEDNPTTLEGLALGKQLFYDPILSVDSTISCSSCHLPELAFTDGRSVSVGINGRIGKRNSPGLANIGYLHQTLFWDGRADDLETQALHPVADPNEMGGSWPLLISKLRRNENYWPAFQRTFGLIEIRELTPDHVGKALAQFQRSLISSDSKYDRVERGEADFTEVEKLGHAIFFDLADEPDPEFHGLPTGECAHCHIPPHFTNQRFFNNGLDEALLLEDFKDIGRALVTGSVYDNGTFRTPGLRNVALTAPYMHDGRFNTLKEVISHYNSGGQYAENRNANIFKLGLSPDQEGALVAFLHTLTDSSFVNNADYHQ
ncbi:MAG: cytochrome c peroxidase [Neolewinella sp.]|jgi:cytochrome c peroxidase